MESVPSFLESIENDGPSQLDLFGEFDDFVDYDTLFPPDDTLQDQQAGQEFESLFSESYATQLSPPTLSDPAVGDLALPEIEAAPLYPGELDLHDDNTAEVEFSTTLSQLETARWADAHADLAWQHDTLQLPLWAADHAATPGAVPTGAVLNEVLPEGSLHEAARDFEHPNVGPQSVTGSPCVPSRQQAANALHVVTEFLHSGESALEPHEEATIEGLKRKLEGLKRKLRSLERRRQASSEPNEPNCQSQPPPKTDTLRKYQCTTCTRSYFRLIHLKRHERSHTNEKPFECPVCLKRFARREILLRHQRQHVTPTPPRDGCWEPGRTKMPLSARKLLEDQFEVDPYLKADAAKRLSAQTGLSEKTIRTWFANTRSRRIAGEFLVSHSVHLVLSLHAISSCIVCSSYYRLG